MKADRREAGEREGRPDRRNQLGLNADMMWSLRQGGRAVTSVRIENKGPESQHWEHLGGNYPSTLIPCWVWCLSVTWQEPARDIWPDPRKPAWTNYRRSKGSFLNMGYGHRVFNMTLEQHCQHPGEHEQRATVSWRLPRLPNTGDPIPLSYFLGVPVTCRPNLYILRLRMSP